MSPHPSRPRRPSPAFAALALALSSPAIYADAPERDALGGTWRCSGGAGEVSFESRWTLEPSGEYSDESSVRTREDVDRDSRAEDLLIESTERGKWSLNEDGRLQFHVTDIELRGLRVDGETIPLERAKSMMEVLLSGAVGRVMMVGIESLDGDTLNASVSGIETTCTR